MRAVILAGGKGTRLLPYTTVIPKPLMPVGDRPILDIIIRQLRRHDFSHVTMAVGHLAELVEAYFRDGQKYGIKIDYSIEDKPLGTIGALSLIDGLDQTFLVMNGDVLTDLEYKKLINYHQEKGAEATIATCQKIVNVDLGVLEMDSGFRLEGYVEKPSLTYSVSMGIYVFEPGILGFIKPDNYLDFPDLVHNLIQAGRKVMAFPFDGYWLDIGRQEDYFKAQDEFELIKKDLRID